MRRLLTGITALVLLAGAAATAYGASTRAEYVAQVDPICANELAGAKRTLGGVNGDLRKGRFGPAATKFARATKVFHKGVEAVAAIPPTAPDASLINQWIGMLRRQVPLAHRAASDLRNHSSRHRIDRSIDRLFKLSDRTQALVQDYGFSDCNFM
jgi:hypothetical protein